MQRPLSSQGNLHPPFALRGSLNRVLLLPRDPFQGPLVFFRHVRSVPGASSSPRTERAKKQARENPSKIAWELGVRIRL